VFFSLARLTIRSGSDQGSAYPAFSSSYGPLRIEQRARPVFGQR